MKAASPSNEKLDALFRTFIRERDFDPLNPVCPVCEQRYNYIRRPNVMHYMARRYLSVRWDPCNAILGCEVCNNNHEFIGHIVEQRFGLQMKEQIEYRARNIIKPDRFKLEDKLYNLIDEQRRKQKLQDQRPADNLLPGDGNDDDWTHIDLEDHNTD